MTKYTKEDYVTYGLDDASPSIIDDVTHRRKQMWGSIQAKLTVIAVSMMVIAGIEVAQFVINLLK